MPDPQEPLWTRDPTGLFWSPPGDHWQYGCLSCVVLVLCAGASVVALGVGYHAFGPNPVLIGAAMVAAFVLVWKVAEVVIEASDRPQLPPSVSSERKPKARPASPPPVRKTQICDQCGRLLGDPSDRASKYRYRVHIGCESPAPTIESRLMSQLVAQFGDGRMDAIWPANVISKYLRFGIGYRRKASVVTYKGQSATVTQIAALDAIRAYTFSEPPKASDTFVKLNDLASAFAQLFLPDEPALWKWRPSDSVSEFLAAIAGCGRIVEVPDADLPNFSYPRLPTRAGD